ncbi:DNA polymerase IV [Anaerovorax sp. IOR16]|uniref:DNA polymerase IV n=1 Tax=Anaerovorax sp. IOR16 TaxID=2773458 RepID=UPI0019CFFFD4|nr:DNA polymerase IV [Anaerovorax sp. IOR16]
MDRIILHCDMNGFYASVELLSLPQLRNRPMAVCGNPDSRHGIILAKNEPAKAYGIVTAETVWQAKRKCPELVLVPPHHDQYKSYSNQINHIYHRFTDLIEPFSIDESWLDVTASTNLFGDGCEIADCIRRTVRKELGLTLSVGVSFNKIFAKMGSEYKKPDATTLISRENFKQILWPLPVGQLFFVGKATAEKLMATGIRTIGDLAIANRNVIHSLLGKLGDQLYDYANGLEDSPVARFCERQTLKSVGNSITFRRDLVGKSDIKKAVTALSDTVSSRLRNYKLQCWGVKIDIKDPYFKIISRQKQLYFATNLGEEIAKAAMELIEKNWNLFDPIRLLTVTAIHLEKEGEEEQLSLFAQENHDRKKQEGIERTMDAIRKKYGGSAITFGGLIHNDIGISYGEEKEDEFKS